ncbi:MAG: ABC transporter ATP-binding protein [Chitinophagaceae bacterium]|nr:ABC transporter ATP-binding protein [Chitinophagaceae bacterium]
MALLEVSGISKQGKDDFSVKKVSFTQEPFQHIAIAGETGSGKTTLLKMIAGLLQPDAGEIKFENKKVIGPCDQLIPGHPGIAYLSQYFELRNNYWVHELLEMANKLEQGEADNIFRICQVDHLTGRRTDQLSGGEKQRIALAGLLITSPRLLLLDEPFSNLDILHKNTIKQVLQDVSEQMNITSILVSHDPVDILSWADTLLLMKYGEIVQQGTPEEVYRQPVNEYCAGLLGDYNRITGPGGGFVSPAPEGKQLMIRPESFLINEKTEHTLSGTVQEIIFCGSHYTIHVQAGGQVIRVRTARHNVTAGEQVFLSFRSSDIAYI